MCNHALYLTVCETAALHSQGTQNSEVHDMIMHASHVIGRGQGHALSMAHKKDIFLWQILIQNVNQFVHQQFML